MMGTKLTCHENPSKPILGQKTEQICVKKGDSIYFPDQNIAYGFKISESNSL